MRILHSRKLIFVSKPRCGSTSVRQFLTARMQAGDEKCDYAGEVKGLHPHMTAPAIHGYLRKKGVDISDYRTFTVTRKPPEMLWSYFKFFQPDTRSRYIFSPRYDPDSPARFENWLMTGRVGLDPLWRRRVPSFVNSSDLSPLSLEAHICNQHDECVADRYFHLEHLDECARWLEDVLQEPVSFPSKNKSSATMVPWLNSASLARLKVLFPMEMEFWYSQ